jgi:hypothetical protein
LAFYFAHVRMISMDPETREMVESTLELARENNKMLRKVRQHQQRAAVWQTLKILVAIGIAFGLFYYLQPYIDKMMQLYSSIFGAGDNLNNGSVEGLLENFSN